MKRGCLLALAAAIGAPDLSGGQSIAATAAHWFAQPPVSDYRLSVSQARFGPLSLVPFGQVALRGPRADRALLVGVGADLAAAVDHRLHLLVGLSGGVLDLRSNLGLGTWASWSAGAGVDVIRGRVIGIGVEARYHRLSRGPVSGVSVGARIGAPRSRGRGRSAPDSPVDLPAGATRDLVQTALDAMGAPYRWGGSDENGFDCSGLIRFAYARIGIDLPRRSAEQATAGTRVPPEPASLQAGDILVFSARPGGPAAHVGLYLGEARFIHSARNGVRISRLVPEDPDGRWWLQRWVEARRVLDAGASGTGNQPGPTRA